MEDFLPVLGHTQDPLTPRKVLSNEKKGSPCAENDRRVQ